MNNIFDKLKNYSDSDYYAFHMPGHKRNLDLMDGTSPYRIDITEIDGFDDLHHAEGILRDAQERAARVYHFYRPSFKPFMAVNETEGAWNWGNMQSINGVPLVVGDSLYFYSSGRQRNKIMWDSYTSTGLATLRRDGFVSIHGDTEYSVTM